MLFEAFTSQPGSEEHLQYLRLTLLRNTPWLVFII